MNLKDQQHISRLVFLYMRGELTASQAVELQTWRDSAEKNEALFSRMISREHFEQSVRRFVKSEADTEIEWQKICRRSVASGKKRILIQKFFRYAALFVLPLSLALSVYWLRMERESDSQASVAVSSIVPGRSSAVLELADGTIVNLQDKTSGNLIKNLGEEVAALGDTLKYLNSRKLGDVEYHTLKVPRGGEYTLVLSDGSKVFLNAESQLKYPVHFSADNRTVYLDGEAYFEVKPDKEKPFIVDVNHLQVKVLGTAFGVRAYAGEEQILTTLVHGKVNVHIQNQDIDLSPDHQASFDKNLHKLSMKPVDVELFVGWKDGRLVFDNEPLEKILANLGRWYSFDVFYVNDEAKDIPFSLNIKKHEKFEEVLELIQQTGKLKFEINKNTVVVK